RVLLRHFVADHHLTFERLRARVGVGEGEHVGRLVVVEELLVEPVDVRAIDECECDLAGRHTLGFEDGAGRVLEALEVERVLVRVGDGNAEHEGIIGEQRIFDASLTVPTPPISDASKMRCGTHATAVSAMRLAPAPTFTGPSTVAPAAITSAASAW